MNWPQALDNIRMFLADPNGDIWDVSEIDRRAIDTMEDLVFSSDGHMQRALIPIVDGTRVYDFPSDFFELRSVKWNGVKLNGNIYQVLEEWDRGYLTNTGTPEFYYEEAPSKIAFYPVPTWTPNKVGTFSGDYPGRSGELGSFARMTVDGTDATFDSEFGVVIDILDPSTHYQMGDELGEVKYLDDAEPVCLIRYVYLPGVFTQDTDEIDLPEHFDPIILWGAVARCLRREGRGQNIGAANIFAALESEMANEWRIRTREQSRSGNQVTSFQPLHWGNFRDFYVRIRR